MRVGFMLCCGVCGDFEIFQFSPVCGPSDVVCEDFEFSEFPCGCVGSLL